MRNKPLSKSTLCISLLMLVCTLLPQRAVGQPAVNYAQTQLGTIPANTYSVIRSVAGGTMAVASMNHAGHASVYLIDPTNTMIIYHADLEDNLFIYDMRVVNSTVYFCGSYKGEGCIGFFDYHDLLAAAPLNIQLKTINFLIHCSSTLYRMAAYADGTGEKVVAVGECRYDHNDSDGSAEFPDCWSTVDTNYLCMRRVVVEADFPAFTMNRLSSEVVAPYDYMQEVIETDNHVAIIGFYGASGGISIHRCNKSNVLLTYNNNWYYYPVTTNECASKIKGCRMGKDTIAIVSMAPEIIYDGSPIFGSVVRMFDLSTMANINAQLVITEHKDEPMDILYVPGQDSLILLHDIYFPSHGSAFNCFISLDPNSPGGYPASCWYNAALNYNSLDIATPNQYIASGGEFWCIDDASTPNNNTTCYRKETVSVKPINCVVSILNYCSRDRIPCAELKTLPLFNTHTVPLVPTCLIP